MRWLVLIGLLASLKHPRRFFPLLALFFCGLAFVLLCYARTRYRAYVSLPLCIFAGYGVSSICAMARMAIEKRSVCFLRDKCVSLRPSLAPLLAWTNKWQDRRLLVRCLLTAGVVSIAACVLALHARGVVVADSLDKDTVVHRGYRPWISLGAHWKPWKSTSPPETGRDEKMGGLVLGTADQVAGATHCIIRQLPLLDLDSIGRIEFSFSFLQPADLRVGFYSDWKEWPAHLVFSLRPDDSRIEAMLETNPSSPVSTTLAKPEGDPAKYRVRIDLHPLADSIRVEVDGAMLFQQDLSNDATHQVIDGFSLANMHGAVEILGFRYSRIRVEGK
jgi:hypothetical protein